MSAVKEGKKAVEGEARDDEKVTVSVRAIVIDLQGRALILHDRALGRYVLPGGRVEPGESLFDALIREVLEETGLVVTVLDDRPQFAGQWEATVDGVPHHMVGIYYLCRPIGGQSEVVLTDEHDTHRWLAMEKRDLYQVKEPDGDALDDYWSRWV